MVAIVSESHMQTYCIDLENSSFLSVLALPKQIMLNNELSA